MKKLLITNDDGIDSPALIPLAKAMQRLGEVTVVAPNRERSWIGKAISKVDPVAVTRTDRDGIEIWSVDGFPADCVHVGAFGILDDLPDLVISGINIGANNGTAYATGSGTLGAAIEASNIGVGGLAFSAMSEGIWNEWVRWVHTKPALEMWTRLAEVAAEVATVVLETGIPDEVDALSVNLPASSDRDTRRVVTGFARTRYGALLAGTNGRYRHAYDGNLRAEGDLAGSDVEALEAGFVSITPVRMASRAPLADDLCDRLERRPG
jgi:5'-nucleotidase